MGSWAQISDFLSWNLLFLELCPPTPQPQASHDGMWFVEKLSSTLLGGATLSLVICELLPLLCAKLNISQNLMLCGILFASKALLSGL